MVNVVCEIETLTEEGFVFNQSIDVMFYKPHHSDKWFFPSRLPSTFAIRMEEIMSHPGIRLEFLFL
jgi:hypothetical protein